MDDTSKDTEWWWIDYLENEMDPSLDKDLQILLEHSQEDRDAFENFRLLKEWLRESDPVAHWPIEPAWSECAETSWRPSIMTTITKPIGQPCRGKQSLSAFEPDLCFFESFKVGQGF